MSHKQAKRRRAAEPPPPAAPPPPPRWDERIGGWLFGPQPIVRLELLRILLPLAFLGFLATRIVHADAWLSDAGFELPDLRGDWRQPLYVPAVPVWGAWALCAVLVISGVAACIGLLARPAAGAFAACLAYVSLADRLEAFTVTKLAPILMLVLALSPIGTRWSVDAWRRRRKDPAAVVPRLTSGGCVRFFQLLLPIFYFSSGICKAKGAWLKHPAVLWTHLHDSYQTWVSWFLANHAPAWSWTVLQGVTLAFEVGAPLWFGLRWTRRFGLAYGVAMHAMIGLMFGPVIWFSLLMISMLVASFAPAAWLGRVLRE
jgi:hypothetical protein